MKLASTNRNRPTAVSPAGDSGAKRGVLRTVPGSTSMRQGATGAPWRLPSGQLLVEYALSACFTGPVLPARFPHVAPVNAPAPADERIAASLENLG